MPASKTAVCFRLAQCDSVNGCECALDGIRLVEEGFGADTREGRGKTTKNTHEQRSVS